MNDPSNRALELMRHLHPLLDLSRDQLCFGEHSLRFELGEGLPNGSTRRIKQAVERACALFESCFAEETELVLVMRDWDSGSEGEIRPTIPVNYVGQLIPRLAARAVLDHSVEENEDLECCETSVLWMSKSDVDVEAIFEGIANLEMGRTPWIGQSLYFMGVKSGLVFYMYDDRGCLIHGRTGPDLAALKRQHGAWLVVPWRSFGN